VEASSPPRAATDSAPTYLCTRFVLLRLLALVYAVAFLILIQQQIPLLGHRGILPADRFLAEVREALGSTRAAAEELPTLFWLDASDATRQVAAWIGLGLALAALGGATNALLQCALWALYLSFVQLGQLFYGYGWETQLCETGFLAIFLCPVRTVRPFASPPPTAVVWLYRWLIARIMLGAGLIKLRGDPCWRDLTCLVYHYETQPVPNPLSWYLHAAPRWFSVAGTAFNHVVELGAPWLMLLGRFGTRAAGTFFVVFQMILIASGNLSFLNWLTIVPALACLDDAVWARIVPRRVRARVAQARERPRPARTHQAVAYVLVALVAVLSVAPVRNLLSPRQAMNRSFDRLHLVNTYGAFGSVGRARDEVILEGTDDPHPGPATVWRPYEFPCKPGDPLRRPCVISPYHYRLDWQIWFAAMSTINREPWLVRLIVKLLRGDADVKPLLAVDPFPDAPPRFIRATLWRYAFTRPGDGNPAWWTRTPVREYLRPIALDDPALASLRDW
jgi:hypothetical protein